VIGFTDPKEAPLAAEDAARDARGGLEDEEDLVTTEDVKAGIDLEAANSSSCSLAASSSSPGITIGVLASSP